jgi:hypothetical protein
MKRTIEVKISSNIYYLLFKEAYVLRFPEFMGKGIVLPQIGEKEVLPPTEQTMCKILA